MQPGNKTTSARWENEPKDNVHDAVLSVFNVVRDESTWRVDADEYHAGLYCASDKPGVKGQSRKGYEYGPATLPYNVCRQAVDTLQSKIAKNRPLPQVLTQKGQWKNQKRARKQAQFLEGEFYRQRIFEKHGPRIVRDAEIFGRGVVKVWTEGKNIRTERVHVWELFYDQWDARYGDPRNIYHCRSMDRGVAIETFARTDSGALRKSIVDAIEKAGNFGLSTDHDDTSTTSTVDRLDVLEAWHLPSGEHAKDGRHVVVVQGATLLDEKWGYGYFPFVELTYNEPLTGAQGHGLVEQLEGYQYEINLSSEKSSEQFRMSGKGILVPDGSGIHDQEIRNGITIMRHKPGMPPQVFDMDLVNEHTNQRPRILTQDALGDSGLSAMSARSEKPAGIESGIGLQTLNDVETERFMIFGRAYETWCLELGRRYIDCAKQIANDYGDLAVSVPMKAGLLDLNWNDVYVEGVELRIFATSTLPQQPGARLDRLKALFDSQVIDRDTFLRQLDSPDMQSEMDLETSDHLVTDEILEAMLEAEEDQGEAAYIPPSAYQDLKWAGRRAQQKYNNAYLGKAPQFNLGMLQRFLKDVDRELKKLEPAPMQDPGAPMQSPGNVGATGPIAPPAMAA